MNSQINMTEEQMGINQNGTENNQKETISLKGEVIRTYEYGDLTVLIYRVISGSPESPLNDFYLVTLDDMNQETAWGIGASMEEALEYATIAFNNMTLYGACNPFKKALTVFKGEDNDEDINC
jgi:hypothetical protein